MTYKNNIIPYTYTVFKSLELIYRISSKLASVGVISPEFYNYHSVSKPVSIIAVS